MNAHIAAEAIQSRFTKDDDGAVVRVLDTYFSDVLGSDWAPAGCVDRLTPSELYDLVKSRAERKYGPLPF